MVPSDRAYDALSHLCFDDIQVDNRALPTVIRVKTNPFRHGVTLYTGASLISPMAAVLSHMVARGSAAGPLFTWADCRYLTQEKFESSVQVTLDAAGQVAINFADFA